MSLKELSNPFSTGSGGANFETRIQASFAVLMLADGVPPCLPHWPIQKIELQAKRLGYHTDNLVVTCRDPKSSSRAKLLCQVKHKISFTKKNGTLAEVLEAAWRDFENGELFSADLDRIALVTGPLSAADLEMRKVLESARASGGAVDFRTKLDLGHFTSKVQAEKAAVFREKLAAANGGAPLSDDEFWRFLKAFHLINYDLDIEYGVNVALLNSLLNQYNMESVRGIWSQLLEKVQYLNQNAGEISKTTLPQEILSAFKKASVETIPAELAKVSFVVSAAPPIAGTHANELSVAQLVGSWNERNESDRLVVEAIAGESYDSWISKLREAMMQPGSPIHHREGVWSVNDRLETWQAMGERLFDSHLDKFRECALKILGECDPKFDLPRQERFAAPLHQKVTAYSHALRKGTAESIALLGSHGEALSNCSQSKAQSTAIITVRELLEGADWRRWGSLNPLLPILAEGAPEEFLKRVEAALNVSDNPFAKLFAEEGDGFMGDNYLTGLLWALEGLAWWPNHLGLATAILGQLDSLDPGGTWANRPLNSLVSIYLPWLPHTTASFEQRKAAIKMLEQENPATAWRLIVKLLHNQTRTTSGTHKPAWRSAPAAIAKEGVTDVQYREQINVYSEKAVAIAAADIAKRRDLVKYLEVLPESAFENALELIARVKNDGGSPQLVYEVWEALTSLTTRHRKFADAAWSMTGEGVQRLEEVASSLQPEAPEIRYQRLFSRNEFDLIEGRGDWKKQAEELEKRRTKAVGDILGRGGAEAVVKFAQNTEVPHLVGEALGRLGTDNEEPAFIRRTLDVSDERVRSFISGYIWQRYQRRGTGWIDGLALQDWPLELRAELLVALGFSAPVWQSVRNLLGEQEALYWSRVRVNPYYEQGGLEGAVGKLLEHGRALSAIECLYGMLHRGEQIASTLLLSVLMAAARTREPGHAMEPYYIIELIKHLQGRDDVAVAEKRQVEWAFLSLLDSPHDASPEYLEAGLAESPALYCEAIRLIFRSTKEAERKAVSEAKQDVALNAYRLLQGWRIPPGTRGDGTFDGGAFVEWLNEVIRLCDASGHRDVALSQLGSVLIHVPKDPGGLWIHKSVAAELNRRELDRLRDGFAVGVSNARGAHMVDPTGKPEFELAAHYAEKAEELDREGYARFAITLRGLADDYRNQGKRIVSEHQDDKE